jgi:hypothetical protein
MTIFNILFICIYFVIRFYIKELKIFLLFVIYTLLLLVVILTGAGSLEAASSFGSIVFMLASLLVVELLLANYSNRPTHSHPEVTTTEAHSIYISKKKHKKHLKK